MVRQEAQPSQPLPRQLEKSGFWGELWDGTQSFVGYDATSNNEARVALNDVMVNQMGIEPSYDEQKLLEPTTAENVGGIIPHFVGLGLEFANAHKISGSLIKIGNWPTAIERALGASRLIKNSKLGGSMQRFAGILSKEIVDQNGLNRYYN